MGNKNKKPLTWTFHSRWYLYCDLPDYETI